VEQCQNACHVAQRASSRGRSNSVTLDHFLEGARWSPVKGWGNAEKSHGETHDFYT